MHSAGQYLLVFACNKNIFVSSKYMMNECDSEIKGRSNAGQRKI